MKILLVVPDTMVGGITTAATNFLNELCKRGHEVSFLDMSGENGNHTSLSCGVDVCKIFGRAKHWNIGNKDVKRAKGIKKLGLIFLGAIKKATIRMGLWYSIIFNKQRHLPEYDLVIAYRQCAPCYKFVLKCVKAKKKLCFAHGELRYMGDISSWKKYMTKFDRNCYVSCAVRDEFCSSFPELSEKARAVHNFFDIDLIKEKSLAPEGDIFDSSVKNIVTVARIDNAFKRIDLIPKACKKIMESGVSNFRWYIIGDGPDREVVEREITALGLEDTVILLGAKSNPYCYMKNADFFVLPSKSEAYPMVVIESFICGLPIVASRFPSLTEMMSDGVEGLIADQTVEGLAECIIRMISDTDGVLTSSRKFLSNALYTNDAPYNQFIDIVENM